MIQSPENSDANSDDSGSENNSVEKHKTEAEEISLEIVRAEAEIRDVEGEIEFTEDQIAPYDLVIQEMQEKIRQTLAEKRDKEAKLWRLKNQRGYLKSSIPELKRKLHTANMEAMKAEEWAKHSAELDELAKLFPWFGAIKRHQFEAAKQIAVCKGRVILGDKRGLGKSLTSLATADLLKSKKLLVISKGEILRNFENEIKKWAPDRTLLSIVSMNRGYRDTVVDSVLPLTDQWTLLVNFESWWRDKSLIRRIAKLQPDTLIIDEAHHAKEVEKNNFRGIENLISVPNMCPNCKYTEIELVNAPNSWACRKCRFPGSKTDFLSVKHVIPMTGSPIMNRPEELFALLNMIDSKTFPNKNYFLEMYCEQNQYRNLMGNTATRWEFRPGGSEQLLRSIGPQFIQRDKKSAGVDIPDQDFQMHYLKFDKEKYPRQYQTYWDLVAYVGAIFQKNSDGDEIGYKVATQASSLITRMRQVISWPMGIQIKETDDEGRERVVWQCDVNESIKIDAAFDLTTELVQEGERVVIFSKFTAVLEELKRRFDATLRTDEKLRAAIYYGKTPNHVRDQIKLDFDVSTYDEENYRFDIVLCQYQAAGEGLNFNAATQTIFIEREWNPEKEGQATGRTNRLGQTKKTQVHILQLDDTIDTDIERMLGDKKDLVGDFETNADMIRQILENSRRNS